MGLIQSRVSKELKDAFSSYCAGENITEAKMLRRLIEQHLKTTSDHVVVPDNAPRSSQINIRINDKMMAKIDERFPVEGYETRADWVTSCVLASLNNEAVLTQDEQNTLRQSNMQLAAIGRNLNQIARQMNKDVLNSHQVSSEMITEIVAEFNTIKKSVSRLIRKNMTRWA